MINFFRRGVAFGAWRYYYPPPRLFIGRAAADMNKEYSFRHTSAPRPDKWAENGSIRAEVKAQGTFDTTSAWLGE